jgi:hypothetical protein
MVHRPEYGHERKSREEHGISRYVLFLTHAN